MKYLFRSWVRRLFSTGSARTIRHSPTLQLEALEDRTTPSFVGVKLIKDIVAGAGASNPNYFTEVNGIIYLAATDAGGDRELWRTDGTAAGTYQVANIHPSGSSNPQNLINVNGTLFFVADHPTYGRELWKSDGTAAGTVLVKDIWSGSNSSGSPYSSSPRYLTNVNGTLFFSAESPSYGRQLWKSDGTTAGTVLVTDIYSSSGISNPRFLTNVNGTLFFSVRGDPWRSGDLWRSDGTAAGTTRVRDGLNPAYLTNVNGTLFFVGDYRRDYYSQVERELWKSDGTPSGTVLVRDLPQPSLSSGSDPRFLTNVNGKLFFVIDDGFHGLELWSSDGTEIGTQLVADICPDTTTRNSSNPQYLTNVNGILFFRASHPNYGGELWKSDGTYYGTQVLDINPGPVHSHPRSLTDVNGTLFFVAYHPLYGGELWRSDGTASGTQLVADIYPNSSSAPRNLTNVDGTLFFTANDGTHGYELWRTAVATTLTITSGNNQSTTVGTAFSSPLVVRVLDQFGEPMAGVPVTFTAPGSGASAVFGSSNTITVTTDANGLAQVTATANNTPGSYTVVASVGSLSTSFSLSNDISGNLVVVSGNNQAATVGSSYSNPLVVRLEDGNGNGIPNVAVTFTAPASNARALFGGNNTITVMTNANGLAQVTATANTIAGTFTVTVSVGSLSTSFTLTNNPGAPAALQIVSGNNQNTTVNTAFGSPLVVQLVDQYGNAVSQSGVSVIFTAPNSGTSASFAGNNTLTVTTGSNGQASSGAFSANTVAGSYQVQVTSGSLTSVQFSLTNNPGAPAALQILSGNNQSTTVNTAFGSPLVVQLVDQYGNAVPQGGTLVTFTAPSTGASAAFGSSSTITVTTGNNGQVSSGAFSANTVAGSYHVQVTSGSLTGVQFSLTNNPGSVASLQIVSGNNQSTMVSTTFGDPLVVRVEDQYGNAVPNTSVTFTAPSSGASATLSSTTVTTGSNGQASVHATANTIAGTYSVTASLGSLSANFNLRNTPGPAVLQIVSGNNQTTTVNTAFANPLVVEVLDQFNNPVPNVNVTFTAPSSGASALFGGNSSITVTTDANGQASVNIDANTSAGSYAVTASVGSLSANFNLTNNADAPFSLQIVGTSSQSTTVNTAFAGPLVVEVRDQYGNPVPNVNVTFVAPSSGASALFGGNSSITVTTDSNGQAQVTATANTVAGSYQVQVTSGSLTGVQFNLTNNPDTLGQLAFRIQPPTAVSVGQRFRVQVQLRDRYGNAVRLPNVAIRLSLRAGSGLTGTLVKRTSANGLATFGDLVLSAPGRYRLMARAGSFQVISRVILVS